MKRINLADDTSWVISSKNFANKLYPNSTTLYSSASFDIFLSNRYEKLNSNGNYELTIGTQSQVRNKTAIIVNISGDFFSVKNDELGINKFFYFFDEKSFIISDNVFTINHLVGSVSSQMNIFLFLLFNYYVDGLTFFKDIYYSQPGTLLTKNKNKLVATRYWTLNDIRSESVITNPKDKLDYVVRAWNSLVHNILETGKESYLTLTGGFDSRLILAAMLNKTKNIEATTFGNKNSRDAVVAKNIANKMNIRHKIILPDREIQKFFIQTADKGLQQNNTLLDPVRVFRLGGIIKEYHDIDLFLGYAGSEIIRGIYPDGLMISNFVLTMLEAPRKGLSLKKCINDYLKNNYVSVDEEVSQELTEYIEQKFVHYDLLSHLFEVMVPLHFGSDINYLQKNKIQPMTPYLHLSFLMALEKTNNIFLLRNGRKLKDSHFQRIDNPDIYVRMLNRLSPQLASMNFTKGYSAKDYIFSKHWAGMKFLYFKYTEATTYANVYEYESWYKDVLKDHLGAERLDFLEIDKPGLLNDLENLTSHREIDYKRFTKILSLSLINKMAGQKCKEKKSQF